MASPRTFRPQKPRTASRTGKEAKLSYGANALMENRNGLVVDFRVDELTGGRFSRPAKFIEHWIGTPASAITRME